ncbi:hypothetical protein HOD38_05675 [archaeon]|jgi:hypothetical protein|nr:hypothetical protein [archaeon]MBT4397731.1 hypothetical protein [archaeon]MBT4441216.1 hypothetical protein [archaeon]
MEKEDILLVANDAILNFPKEIKSPILMTLSKDRFSKYLNLMKLTKHLNKTPCFIAEMKGGSVIYFCEEIVNHLIKQYKIRNKELFIKAITLHELYHSYNHLMVNTEGAAVFSEILVHQEMKKEFPKEYKFLNRFTLSNKHVNSINN